MNWLRRVKATQSVSYLQAALAVVVLLLVGHVLLVAEPRDSTLSLVGDDAGYYFNIARNYCLGWGITFDRIHATNGFNPLYTTLLILVYKIFLRDYSITDCYRLGVLVDYAAMVFGCIFFVGLLRQFLGQDSRRAGPRSLLLSSCLAFYVFFVGLKSFYGVDAPLVLLFGNLYLYRVSKSGLLAPGIRAAIFDGVLLGLLFLARVDSLPFIGAAYALMLLLAFADRARLVAAARRLACTLAVAIPYVIWSWFVFSTWMPISAKLKSSFPHASLSQSLDVFLHTSLNGADKLAFLVAWPLSLLYGLWLLRARAASGHAEFLRSSKRSVLALLSLYLLARLTFVFLFSRFDVQGSHAILVHVFLVLMLIAGIEAAARRGATRGGRGEAVLLLGTSVMVSVIALALLAGKMRTTWAKFERRDSAGLYDEFALAQEVRALTLESDVLFGSAYGLAGFFADRSWINADGVANDYDYQRVFQNDGLDAYLRRSKVTHVVFPQGQGIEVEPGRIRLDFPGVLCQRNSTVYVRRDDIVSRTPSLRTGSEIIVARFGP